MHKSKYIFINDEKIYEDFEQKIIFLEELNQNINKEEEINLIIKKLDDDLILLSEEILNISPNIILLKEINESIKYEEIKKEIERLNLLKVNKLIIGLENEKNETIENYKNITKKIAFDIIHLIKDEDENHYTNKIEIIPVESWVIYSYIIKILKRTGNEDKINSFIENLKEPKLLSIIYKSNPEVIKRIEKIKLEILPILENELSSEKFKEILDEYIENNLKIFLTEPNETDI